MFNIFEKKGQTIIQLSRGNNAEIQTFPYCDSTGDNIYNPDDYDTAITLDENSYVIFSVSSPSGRNYIRKVLTKDNYNDNGELTLCLTPADTKDMQPFRYMFDFTYFCNGIEQEAYTYSNGVFEILNALCDTDDLNEYLNPPTDEPINPDVEPDTPNPDDTTGDDTTDEGTGG